MSNMSDEIYNQQKEIEELKSQIKKLKLDIKNMKKNNVYDPNTFNDIPLLRRELISRKFLKRKDNGSIYWKVN